MATRKRGCTGSLSVAGGGVVGAGVAVTAGMNLCLVGVGGAVGAGAAGACVAVGAGGCVGASFVGAIVGAGVGAGACVGTGVGIGVATGAAGVGVSSSPPQATMTIAITTTKDSTANVCHLLIHNGVFTSGPPCLSQKLHCDKQAHTPA